MNKIYKMIGWRVTLFFGDPLVMDRWSWLKPRLQRGDLRTFDAGCGNGCFSFGAATYGNSVVAGSYDVEPIRKARFRADLFGLGDSIHFIDIDLTKLSERSNELGKFDQIICTECIEHIHKDQQLVSDLAEILKPGGRLFLTTPELNHRGLRYEKQLQTEPGGHVVWGYSKEKLCELMENAGLEVLEVSYFSGFVSQQLTNLMRGRGEKIKWALTFPLRIFQCFDRAATRAVRFPWFGIGIVARKPN